MAAHRRSAAVLLRAVLQLAVLVAMLVVDSPVTIAAAPGPAASSSAAAAPPQKRAIYWKGDLLAFNATATRSVIGRGFTHAVVGTVNNSRWLCNFARGALRPILDVSPHNKLASWPPLRTLSPFSQLEALKAANATLLRVLKGAPGCVAGVLDDIEELPFPLTSYTQAGSVDSYHSNNLSNLLGMIGTRAPAGDLLWPSFADWPTRGAHRVPDLTIETIEYNFPKLSLQIGSTGSWVAAIALDWLRRSLPSTKTPLSLGSI